jgi:histidinol-phosphate aminotransferase
VLLHANENPYPPPDDVLEEIYKEARKVSLNRYPSPHLGQELRDMLAAYAGVSPEWVWIGDGSNEVLLQCCLAYGGPGRKALVFEPTYRMHHRQARMSGMDVVDVRRESDFTIDVDKAVSEIEATRPHIVFVCTPNNPTGTLTSHDDVLRIVEAAPGLAVVDEAYYEFSKQTLVRDLGKLPNVIVARTLSKAFRMAGVRLGYGVASPDLLAQLGRVRMPYAQSSFAQIAATVAIRRRQQLLDVVDELVSERDRISIALAKIEGIEVFPSHANFVLFRCSRAAEVNEALGAKGMVIRDFTHLEGCEGCLRVTVGTPAENDEFLEAVRVAS